MKNYVLPALLVMGAIAFAAIQWIHRAPAPAPSVVPHQEVQSAPKEIAAVPVPVLVAPEPPAPALSETPAPPAMTATVPPPSAGPTSSATTKPAKVAKVKKPKLAKAPSVMSETEKTARDALALVGADPAAEAVYIDSINDPNTPAELRHDLIEDLNQDGFADPKHPTVNDLPVIENRIALIEQLGPFAMDDTNDAAFGEAYKDLLNMESKVLSQQ